MDFRQIPLNKILFLDIETVPAFPEYSRLPEQWKKLWDKKASYINRDGLPDEEFYQRAGIYAEFGKVIAVSLGIITENNGRRELRLKTIYGDNEKCILEKLARILDQYYANDDNYLCAHNGKEFDFPFLARRMLVNNVKIPKILDTHGKKPWETHHLDTMELWKFGDHKHFTSLELLATLFDLPSPKTDIDGSEVWKIYWQDKDLERIAEYCEKDTITVAQLFLKFRNQPPVPKENIIIAERDKCD